MNDEWDLESLLPHRKPMLLIDRILRLGSEEIVAEKKILREDFFLQGHYPGYAIVPGVITCECLFQAGAALLAHRLRGNLPPGSEGRVPVVARIERAKFREPIRPDDVVHLLVTLKETVGTVFYLKGEARVNDKVRASTEFTCAMAPRQP